MILRALFKKKAAADTDRRRAFRVSIKDLKVVVHGKEAAFSFTVKDVSASGVGLLSQAKAFKPGVTLRLDLIVGKKPVCQGLIAKVVRAESGVVGCQFEGMDKKQEAALTEIVLVEQKRQANARKGKGVEDAVSPMEIEGALTFEDPWSKKKQVIVSKGDKKP